MKKLLYAIILALSVVLYAGCEEQVFDYDFINMPEGGGSTTVDSDRVIYYTTTDGLKIKAPNGIMILESHIYEKGVGMLRYNKAVNNIPANAFSGCSTLKTITLPESVAAIGEKAFYDCTGLKSVNIPEKVSTIGDEAFSGCSGELTINSKIIETDCGGEYPRDKWLKGSGFTKVVIGKKVEKIGNHTFHRYSSLTSVTIPNSVTSIGEFAFSRCTGLTNVSIPNSVKSISNYAFQYCTSLTSVAIPESVISIGDYAFDDCSNLTRVNISNLVAWLKIAFSRVDSNPVYNGADLYLNGNKLTELTIPSEITSLNDFVFYNCSSLTSVTIHDKVTSIGKYSFNGCSNLTRVNISNLAAWCNMTLSNGSSNPLCNGADLYLNGNKLTVLTIPSEITSVNNFTFYGYTSLTSVAIHDKVALIGRAVFSDCTGLTSVTIGNSVTSIDALAFYRCSNLVEIYCKPTTPPALGDTNVFDYGPSAGRQIYVPSASVEAYKTATNWSEYADQIVADPSSSGASTTQYFIEYTSTDGNVVTPYDSNDFGANIVSNIYENGKGRIYFDGAITKIGENAFRNCSTLSGITIPETITTIGAFAFDYCSNLTRVNISNLVAWCKIVFGNGYSNPLSNKADLYLNGNKLTELTIPSEVASIKDFAFNSCTSLTSVTIHGNVTSIGNTAFCFCSNLVEIYCKPTTPPILGSYVFGYGPSSGRKIYVPSGSVNAYKTATNWSEWAGCIVADPSSSGSQTYKVGDYYNVNGKQGVIFWVDETGQHGKIVSLTESTPILQWTSDAAEQKRLIGADDDNNGANNMAKVKQISGWELKYPAFKWCADLGEGWYLPAIEEIEMMTLNTSVRDVVNSTLSTKGTQISTSSVYSWYWSSAECDKSTVWCVSKDGNSANYSRMRYSKDNWGAGLVRAVFAF